MSSSLLRIIKHGFTFNNKSIYSLQLFQTPFSSTVNSGPHPGFEPIANRPLRGQSSSNSNSNSPKPSRRFDSETRKPVKNNETDDKFLERLKLGFDKKPEPEPVVVESVEASETGPEDVDEIFRKIKETGLIPNAVAMLDGLCKDGLVKEAMKLFQLMREKGSIPEVVVYTAVVEGFCKAHKFDDAKRIFKKMLSNGVVPNAFSYGVFVRGLCKGGLLEDAFEVSVEMLESGHSLNLPTFVGLVEGYCREKGVEEAVRVIGEMKGKGFFVEEKAVREFLDKKGPFLPLVWEAILGKNAAKRSFF